MNETVNLHLPQFEASDRIQHDDFNDAFAAIDAAVAGAAKIKTGTYTGTGTSGSGNPTTLTFDFAPQLVIIMFSDKYCRIFARASGSYYDLGSTVSSVATVTNWTENSLQLYCVKGNDASSNAYGQMNKNGETYHYIAIG